jgi:hypothetical protein
MTKNLIKLSASKIKTYSSCSYYGYAKYNIGLPDKGNLGSDLGGIVHTVLEVLSIKKRYDYVVESIASKNSFEKPSVKKLIEKLLKKKDILTEENLSKINGFLMTAFTNDFFDEDCLDVKIEYEFDIKTETYWVGGFIDKLKVKNDKVVVLDYKSSKKKFQGEELSFNIQGLLYSLVASKMYPDKKVEVEFIFLKFPKAPYIKMSFSKQYLDGFENYLAYVSERLANFGIEEALADMAAKGGRGRSWQCGKENPFELKEDLSPHWVCPFRLGFLYFSAEKFGCKSISAYTKKELIKYLEQGYNIVQKRYNGCPAWTGKSI